MSAAYSGYPPRRGSSVWMLVLYIIVSAYFINFPFNFINIPSGVDPFNKWIILVGGVLLLFGAINHYRVGRNMMGY